MDYYSTIKQKRPLLTYATTYKLQSEKAKRKRQRNMWFTHMKFLTRHSHNDRRWPMVAWGLRGAGDDWRGRDTSEHLGVVTMFWYLSKLCDFSKFLNSTLTTGNVYVNYMPVKPTVKTASPILTWSWGALIVINPEDTFCERLECSMMGFCSCCLFCWQRGSGGI